MMPKENPIYQAAKLYEQLHNGVNPTVTFTYWAEDGSRYHFEDDAFNFVELKLESIDAEGIAYGGKSFAESFDLLYTIAGFFNESDREALRRLDTFGYRDSELRAVLIRLHCENWDANEDLFENVYRKDLEGDMR